MPRPTPAAAILENTPSPVASLPLDSIDHRSFHGKIAELKGKIKEWHQDDPAFALLGEQISKLDDDQNAVEARNVEAKNTAMGIGAVLVPVAVIGIAKAMTSTRGNDLKDLDRNVTIGLVTLITIPLQAYAGALIGGSIAESHARPDLVPAHKRELLRLIDSYNTACDVTPMKQVPDTTK